MNGKKAKLLRRTIREERAGEAGVVDNELVIAGRGLNAKLIQSPQTVRAFTKQLKRQYTASQRGIQASVGGVANQRVNMSRVRQQRADADRRADEERAAVAQLREAGGAPLHDVTKKRS